MRLACLGMLALVALVVIVFLVTQAIGGGTLYPHVGPALP